MSTFGNPANWFVDWIRGMWRWGQDMDTHVSQEAAIGYPPIWYGISKIAGHAGSMPMQVRKRLDRGSEVVRQHSTARLLRRPSALQTASRFRAQLIADAILEGNGRAAIVREMGRPVELVILHPYCTVTGLEWGEKLHASKPNKHDRLRKFFNPPDNSEEGTIVFKDEDILHIPGLSLDGVSGLSLREIAGRNLSASINTERRIAKQMQEGFAGQLLLSAPPGVLRKQEDAEQFMELWKKRHHGTENAGEPALMREGITASILETNNRDAEMTENRKFQRQDAALLLGLESILGDDESVSYNSLSEKNKAYILNTLMRWLTCMEEEFSAKLLPPRQFFGDTHYLRFDTSNLVKPLLPELSTTVSTLVTARVISPNEAREMIGDLNPYPGGDEFINPAITQAPGTEEAQQEDMEDTEEEDAAQTPAAQSRLQHLCKVEASRVVDRAKRAAAGQLNYIEWLDSFYADDGWPKTLREALESMQIDGKRAATHCAESKRRLIEAAGYATPETLELTIREATKNWQSRSKHV